MMRVLITTTQVPFVRGGAEMHAEALMKALRDQGHQAEIVSIPFKWYPPERILDAMLACQLLDLTESCGVPVDLVIGLKFPAYLIPHPKKVLWILHQHRQAYDRWDHPLGDLIHFPQGQMIRAAIKQADQQLIPQARHVYANSRNVANRLKRYCDIDATPLYHPPPNMEQFYTAEAEHYFFYPSRLSPDKRQEMVLEAMRHTRHPVRVRFAGAADNPEHGEKLRKLAQQLKVHDRVEWLGSIDEANKREQYARALGVIYVPVDEDYGYVTLEAMLASKPTISCTDSGGPLEFVKDRENGLIASPTPQSLAVALDTLWENRTHAAQCGRNGRALLASLNITWPEVVRRLVS